MNLKLVDCLLSFHFSTFNWSFANYTLVFNLFLNNFYNELKSWRFSTVKRLSIRTKTKGTHVKCIKTHENHFLPLFTSSFKEFFLVLSIICGRFSIFPACCNMINLIYTYFLVGSNNDIRRPFVALFFFHDHQQRGPGRSGAGVWVKHVRPRPPSTTHTTHTRSRSRSRSSWSSQIHTRFRWSPQTHPQSPSWLRSGSDVWLFLCSLQSGRF